MRFTRWILAFTVVAAAGTTLGFIAFSLADREYTEQVAGLDRLLEGEATLFARRTRAALLPAYDSALAMLAGDAKPTVDSPALRTLRLPDGGLRYGPDRQSRAVSADEQAQFDRGLWGGESYEFTRHDYARAIDAYSFYLDRLSHPDLKDRLRFRIARAASRSGRTSLAIALYQDLHRSGSFARENGLPVSLLSGVRWIDLDDQPETRDSVLLTLRDAAPSLPTERVAHFTSAIAPNDSVLTAFIKRRDTFESAVSEIDPSGSDDVVLGEHYLLVTTDSPAGVEIAGVPMALPPFEADDLRLTMLDSKPSLEMGAASEPLRLRDDGSTLAWIEVRDPAHRAKRELAAQRRTVAKSLVTLLLVLVGGACVALWIAIDRQRRLAELKVRLLANVSHELKTPITSIRIFSEMLAEETLEESKVRQFGRLLTAESRRLTQRIEDLLDYAQDGRAAQTLVTEELDVVSLLAPLADTFQYRAKDHRVDFRSDLRAGTEELRSIRTNANAVERIVLNLLDNALKYRSKDEPWIALKLKATPRALQIQVKDNGVGIAPKDQERIFEEFFRARFEEYGVQGTGLGLSIARVLAERIQARLFVDSRPGIGSTFVLEIPFAVDLPQQPKEAVS